MSAYTERPRTGATGLTELGPAGWCGCWASCRAAGTVGACLLPYLQRDALKRPVLSSLILVTLFQELKLPTQPSATNGKSLWKLMWVLVVVNGSQRADHLVATSTDSSSSFSTYQIPLCSFLLSPPSTCPRVQLWHSTTRWPAWGLWRDRSDKEASLLHIRLFQSLIFLRNHILYSPSVSLSICPFHLATLNTLTN